MRATREACTYSLADIRIRIFNEDMRSIYGVSDIICCSINNIRSLNGKISRIKTLIVFTEPSSITASSKESCHKTSGSIGMTSLSKIKCSPIFTIRISRNNS